MTNFTPREIVSELDKYIIAQNDAKRAVAIALRNRWRRQRVSDELKDEVFGLLVVAKFFDGTVARIGRSFCALYNELKLVVPHYPPREQSQIADCNCNAQCVA